MNRRLDRGSAPVEFVLVSVLLAAVALSVLQVAFIAHIRAIAIDSAIAGAAHAALADTDDAEGVRRATDLISRGIASSLLRDVTVNDDAIDGRPAVVVTVDLGLPVIGPWLPLSEMTVRGRAFREGR
jgi:uncharacterized protein YoxC